MATPCGTMAGNHLLAGVRDDQGCVLLDGHQGPHEFVDERGQHWQWETDLECDCEDCLSGEGDYCITYWRVDSGAVSEHQARTQKGVPPTVLAEAQSLLSDGYRGLQKDVAEKLGWPIGRVASIAGGVVCTGAKRYGTPAQQVQAVVVVARTLIENKQRN